MYIYVYMCAVRLYVCSLYVCSTAQSPQRSCWLLKPLHVALRNKHSENTAVDVQSSDRPDLYRGGQSIRLPEGSKPHAASLPHAVRFIYSLVTCSLLSRTGSGRSSQLPCASPLSVCRCYRGLFVFRGPLFSSVASVSCSSTGGVTCLCVRLFQAVGQLNLLGLECSCAPVDPLEGSYCLPWGT